MRVMRDLGRLMALTIFIAGLAGATQPALPVSEDAGAGAAASMPAGQFRLLQRHVGVWDATIQILNASDGTLGVYNGTETNTLEPDGRWLATVFRSRRADRGSYGRMERHATL